MNLKNKISIIIPYYNTITSYFIECIDSVINQTYQNTEILIINDGSSQKNASILKKYQSIKNIKIVNKDHEGVSVARNIGIGLANGEWIMFVDSDDWLELNACEKFIDIVKNNNDLDIIISKCYINTIGLKRENYSYYNNSFNILDKQEVYYSIFQNFNNKFTCVDTPWAKLFNKNFLISNNFKFKNNLKNGEDGIFNFETIYKANNIYFFTDKTYNYRVNEYSVCNTFSNDLDESFTNLILSYTELFQKYNMTEEKKDFDSFITRILCRLLRKFYSKYSNYTDFHKKIKKIMDKNMLNQQILGINLTSLSFERKVIIFLFQKEWFVAIYFLTRLKVNVK